MVHRMHRSLIVSVVVLAVIAAGCGSDSPTGSVDQIQSFADQQLQLRLKPNQSADPFTCEEDDGQWKCTTEVTTNNENGDADTAELTVNVTCETSANCTYTPET